MSRAHIRIEFRSAQGQADRLPVLAEELVQLKVNAIVVGTEPAVRAAKEATSTIPIVTISSDYDPVASGLIGVTTARTQTSLGFTRANSN